MKSIKYYIVEAFKINKNTKIEKLDNPLIRDIINVIEFSKLIPEKSLNKHRGKLYEVLGKFINENGFTEIDSISVVNNTANGLDAKKLKAICDNFSFFITFFRKSIRNVKMCIHDFGYNKRLLQLEDSNELCLSKKFDNKDNYYDITLRISFD